MKASKIVNPLRTATPAMLRDPLWLLHHVNDITHYGVEYEDWRSDQRQTPTVATREYVATVMHFVGGMSWPDIAAARGKPFCHSSGIRASERFVRELMLSTDSDVVRAVLAARASACGGEREDR